MEMIFADAIFFWTSLEPPIAPKCEVIDNDFQTETASAVYAIVLWILEKLV